MIRAHLREQNQIVHIAVVELDLWGLDLEKKHTTIWAPPDLSAREQPLLNDWIVHHQVEVEHPELECREHQKNLPK